MTAITTVSGALEDLARRWSDTGDSVRELVLSALVHPSLAGTALDGAWESYRDAVLKLDDLRHGVITWRECNDELTCPDRDGAAQMEVCADVDAALSFLIDGPRRGAGTGN